MQLQFLFQRSRGVTCQLHQENKNNNKVNRKLKKQIPIHQMINRVAAL